jgi:hypothetical protein
MSLSTYAKVSLVATVCVVIHAALLCRLSHCEKSMHCFYACIVRAWCFHATKAVVPFKYIYLVSAGPMNTCGPA